MVCLTASAVTACGGGLSDARHPTGSQTLATSSDYKALYVASTDHGAVTRFDIDTQTTTRFEAGFEPMRIARADERVFVTLRGERAVAVFDETKDGLELVGRVEVGAEPYGIVAKENGDQVYVAVSMADKVVEIDTEELEISNEWTVRDQPRWLALHPDGTIYVGSGMNGTFSYIRDDEVFEAELPRLDRGSGPFDVRIMGDMAVSSDGYYVAVPTMNIDPKTPIDDTGFIPPVGYYTGRSDHTVVLIPAEGGEPDMDGRRVIALSNGQQGDPLGYASSVSFDPQGFKIIANIEGADSVVIVDIEGDKGADGGLFTELFSSDPLMGRNFPFAETRPLAFATAPDGPRSVVFTDDNEGFVYGFLDRAVAKIDTSNVKRRDDDNGGFGGGFGFGPGLVAPKVDVGVQVAPAAFTPEIEQGRRMFYTTQMAEVSNPMSGLSCNTCHFDSRNDGVSWTFTRGKRQTPSLAGKISLTAPVRWQGDRATVAIDAESTSRDAMGGTGMNAHQSELVEAFIDSTRDVDVPLATSSDPAIARGLAIFSRPEVGCANCHNGERMTDNQPYSMYGMTKVYTRSLIGLASSPPYLHDGSAATVRDVLLTARNGEMGDTSSLTEAELDDLEMFLLSL